MNKDPFKEYLKQSEPNKRDRGYAWHIAIGLQAVDGLKPSKYLIDTAIKNIEGDISIDEAQELLNTYYEENPKADTEERTEEADKVAVRIAKILSEKAFSFTPNEYISIHKKLFAGIYGHAGKLRDYNITKKEWVLNGATVLYGSASELLATLDYDFSEEKKFSYKNLSMEEIIHHLAIFVSRLWQIHVFGEGNTRTTAVFFIKYLRTLGFDATNDIFAENAWYFRNALVRANYNDLKNGVHETTEYLELFLRNLLLDENNELHNRSMHISGMFAEVDIKSTKVNQGKENIEVLEWKEISTEHIIQDEWIDFRKSAYRFPDGSVFEPFYSYSRRDYVVIVASDVDGNFLCVRQFRQGIKKVTTEFPAGGIERKDGKEYGEGNDLSAENALLAAKRELLEETGYESEEWKHLLTVPSNATMADNYAHLYVARNCRRVSEQSLDETEFLNVMLLSAQEIEEMIEKGEFQQAIHIMAWLLSNKK